MGESGFFYHLNPSDLENRLALVKLHLREGASPQEVRSGFLLCTALAEEGQAEAQYTLAHLYRYLEAEVKDYLKTTGFYQEREEKLPLSDRPTFKKAVQWYHLAARQNHKKAAFALAQMYERQEVRALSPASHPREDHHQLQEALTYYQIASRKGSVTAARKAQELTQILAKTLGAESKPS